MTPTYGNTRWIRTCSAVALAAGCACGPALARQSAAWGEYSFSNIDNLSEPVAKISGGAFHVVVLKADGTVAAWGKGIYGECNVPPGLRNVVDVSAGYWHSAALRSDGTIEVWGATDLTDLTPKSMPLLSAMDCGRYFMLAVRTDGTVFGWGEDQMGQLDVPPGLTGVVKVAGGTNHSAAVRADGTVVAWGSNSSGQCNVPSDLGLVVAIDANSTSTVVLQSNGVARCWGAVNSAGEPNVVGIAAQGGGLAMLRADGTIARFGSLPPITGAYTALQPAAVLGVGGAFYVAMRTDGVLVGRAALANNIYGAATPPPQFGQIRSMAADANSAVRVFATADGRLARWETRGESASPTVRVVKDVGALLLDLQIGRKVYGRQLDGTWRCFDGDMLDEVALSPELSSALAVSAGPWHTLVLRADRTVVCVDSQGASSFATVPPGLGLANDVSACDQGSAAILQDGSVAYWGNYEDVRGDMPPGLDGVVHVSIGGVHGAAVKADGSGVIWGDYETLHHSVPTTGAPFRKVLATPHVTMWLQQDGAIQIRGSSTFGIRNVPPGLSSVTEMNAGVYWAGVTSLGTTPADVDGNAAIDGQDLGLLLGNWGITGHGCPGDVNGDAVVDGADLGILLGLWGPIQ